jgi:uncharacterized protein YhaN
MRQAVLEHVKQQAAAETARAQAAAEKARADAERAKQQNEQETWHTAAAVATAVGTVLIVGLRIVQAFSE